MAFEELETGRPWFVELRRHPFAGRRWRLYCAVIDTLAVLAVILAGVISPFFAALVAVLLF
jgi:hypothetical protein